MGNQAQRNYRSSPVAANTGSWTEITDEFESYFSLYVAAEGVYLSIGHAVPDTVLNSVEVPAGGSFSMPTGVIGPIFVRSLTASNTTAFVVGA